MFLLEICRCQIRRRRFLEDDEATWRRMRFHCLRMCGIKWLDCLPLAAVMSKSSPSPSIVARRFCDVRQLQFQRGCQVTQSGMTAPKEMSLDPIVEGERPTTPRRSRRCTSIACNVTERICCKSRMPIFPSRHILHADYPLLYRITGYP